MLDRYSKPEMADRFSVQAQWAAVLRVEIAASRARMEIGKISPDEFQKLNDAAPQITPEIVAEIAEREETTDHDVAAFVDVVQKHINHPSARWFHYGLTSADVTDTGLCLRLHEACGLLNTESEKLLGVLCDLAREFSGTPTAGRTHGQHAEVITFGVRLTNWALMLDRAIESLTSARKGVAVGKLSGACGTYTNTSQEVEELACKELGLTPIVATQVISRDIHAEVIYACIKLGNAIGHMSFNLRSMAATEFGEVEEGRRPGQKGSSAMPHKRNPIKTEQFSGLARTLRGYLASTLEQTELLFERDISHSAPERIVLADALILTHYMVVSFRTVLERLVVKPERMQQNIDRSYGLMFTQTLLTEMISQGWQRDEAYRLVQRLATQALEDQVNIRELVEANSDIDFAPGDLDRIFDQARMLRNTPLIISKLPR